jgi:hypothetical protein
VTAAAPAAESEEAGAKWTRLTRVLETPSSAVGSVERPRLRLTGLTSVDSLALAACGAYRGECVRVSVWYEVKEGWKGVRTWEAARWGLARTAVGAAVC